MRTLLSLLVVTLALSCVSCTYPGYMGAGIQAGYMQGPMGAIGGYRYGTMGGGYPMPYYGGGMNGMYGGGMYGGGMYGGGMGGYPSMYGGGMYGGGMYGGGMYGGGMGGYPSMGGGGYRYKKNYY